jgi:hypothetical protein
MKLPPDVIYLQWDDEDGFDESDEDEVNPHLVPAEEVTWCEDQINEYDIKYVKAELLQEAVDWLEHAEFDYRNGNEAFGVDEGDVLGWKAHTEMVNKFKRVLGIPISDVEKFIEKMNNKLPDDDFPF